MIISDKLIIFTRTEEEQEEITDHCEDYNSSLYSPQYVSVDSLEPGTIIVSEEDDLNRLKFMRSQVQNSGSRVEVSFSFSTSNHQTNFIARVYYNL